MKSKWLVSTISVSLAAVALAAAGSGYHVVTTYKVGGEGGWDYLTVDSEARRVYISRGTHVMVLDADSGKSVGDIADTPGVHGIALAPELGRGFTSNGRENTVSIFDIKTLATSSKVKVGENPDAILYDPATKRVFTFNGRSADSTAIDATSGKVLGTIKLDGKPEFAASDAKGEIFVNIEDKSELVAIDPNKLEVKAKWPLAPCTEPSGLAIDRKNRRLYVGCDNKMMAVVDADSGKVLATPAIGEGVDATAFDPETGLAFASCGGDGVLTVVKEESPGRFTAENVPAQKGARTMALDPKTHNVFVVTAKFGPPPAATAENPHPRRSILPDSFEAIVLGTTPALSHTAASATAAANAAPEVQTPVEPPSQSPASAAPGPLADFVDALIVRDIKARLGNCGGKINVTDVSVADKVVSGGQGEALLSVTANWVAPNEAFPNPAACLGFSQGRGNNQKTPVRAIYRKWESGWRLEHISIDDIAVF